MELILEIAFLHSFSSISQIITFAPELINLSVIAKPKPWAPPVKIPTLSFKSFDEIIERANNNDLGLSSYICTNSMEQAHRASELMETGTVSVNTPLVAIAEAPFRGIKQTGYGREGGSMAIKDYLNVKYTQMGIKG